MDYDQHSDARAVRLLERGKLNVAGGTMTNPEVTPPANGPEVKTFSQAQVDSIAATARREALTGYFKGAGLDNVPTAEQIAAALKAQQDQQSETQKLQAEAEAGKGFKSQAETLQAVVEQQRIAATLQLPPRFWKFVEGATEDEIKVSVNGLKQELGLPQEGGQQQEQTGQQQGPEDGQPRPPAPAPQQGTGSGTPPPAKTMQSGADAYRAKHGLDKKD